MDWAEGNPKLMDIFIRFGKNSIHLRTKIHDIRGCQEFKRVQKVFRKRFKQYLQDNREVQYISCLL